MATQFTKLVQAAIDEHIQVAQSVSALNESVGSVVEMLVAAYRSDGKLLICGNGGSAADAQHIAAELTGRYLKERRPLPALALNVNTSAVTAIANDYGYEASFARQLEAHSKAGDVLLAISTSGNSPNVLNAVRTARSRGLRTVGMTGAKGGKLAGECDICLCIPAESTPRIQEMHIMIGHIICGLVEDALF